MVKDAFDLPDMDDLTRQMEDAMSEAQKAMEDLPTEMGALGDVMGSLSALMGGMPAQMAELGGAVAGFGEQHEANIAASAGEPDWLVGAGIRVGETLHVVVRAVFDLAQVREAWQSTQDAGFESLVAGVIGDAARDFEPGLMDQITGQLQKGRSVAVVEAVDVRSCRIQGAPADATETLQLSPEANIPLVMGEEGLGFEFAPLLTIRNRWEHAAIPSFVPTGAEIVVPLTCFDDGVAFMREFEPSGQEARLRVTLGFEPLV